MRRKRAPKVEVPPMDLVQALSIVLNLAVDNQLWDSETELEDGGLETARQSKAISKVEAFILALKMDSK